MKTRIYRPTPHNLRLLAKRLRRGEIVAVPAETVYGLAADALNPKACQRIFTAKQRPANDPLIVHVANRSMARNLCKWNEQAERLAKAFWPGPLTIVLPKKDMVPDIVTSGKPTVALRVPGQVLFRKLIRETKRPLAAPSANPFGYISPTSAEHVKAELDGKIPAILNGGPCPIGLESTIIDLSSPRKTRLLRPGSVSREALAEVLQSPVTIPNKKSGSQVIDAPGMMDRHYSPRTLTYLAKQLVPNSDPRHAWVFYSAADIPTSHIGNCFALSANGQGHLAAQKLYRILRHLDAGQFDAIHIQQAPANTPWSVALNDRMKRAAALA